MRSSEIVALLREQFQKPDHSLEMGRPMDGGSMTAVYEIYPDGVGRTLWARFDSFSDAEAVVTAINEACKDDVSAKAVARTANGKLKVFRIATFLRGVDNGRQVIAIIAATSKKAAANALSTTVCDVTKFASVTDNANDIKVATAEPGVVFWCSTNARESDPWNRWETSR